MSSARSAVFEYANPDEGIYVTSDGLRIFILRNQDGPYQMWDKKKKQILEEKVSVYTVEDENGVHRRVTIQAPFNAKKLDGISCLRKKK